MSENGHYFTQFRPHLPLRSFCPLCFPYINPLPLPCCFSRKLSGRVSRFINSIYIYIYFFFHIFIFSMIFNLFFIFYYFFFIFFFTFLILLDFFSNIFNFDSLPFFSPPGNHDYFRSIVAIDRSCLQNRKASFFVGNRYSST